MEALKLKRDKTALGPKGSWLRPQSLRGWRPSRAASAALHGLGCWLPHPVRPLPRGTPLPEGAPRAQGLVGRPPAGPSSCSSRHLRPRRAAQWPRRQARPPGKVSRQDAPGRNSTRWPVGLGGLTLHPDLLKGLFKSFWLSRSELGTEHLYF